MAVKSVDVLDRLYLAAALVAGRKQGAIPVEDSPRPIWVPFSGPQTQALETEADELYYGGAAGGGKSAMVCGLAATQHTASVIFRREYPQLSELKRQLGDIVKGLATWSGYRERWTFHDGRFIELGAVQHEDDVDKWQGRPHDLIAFDELPQFSRLQYRTLTLWNRTTLPRQRCRVVAGGNPPGNSEGEWVIERWGAWLDPQHAYPALPGELRWYAMVDDVDTECDGPDSFDWKGETLYPRSRTFIPARLEDNPLLSNTPEYRAMLQSAPEPRRSQLLYGDHSIGLADDAWQVIPTQWLTAAERRWTPDRPIEDDGTLTPLTCLGVDIAAGGRDRTILWPRYGTWFDKPQVHEGKSTPTGIETADLVLAALAEAPDAIANLDAIMVGSRALDVCRDRGFAQWVHGVNFATQLPQPKSQRRERLLPANIRAAAYFALRSALDPDSGYNLAIPPMRDLRSELLAHHWKVTSSGAMIEEKDDIKKRLGRSPDLSDALVLSLWDDPRRMLGAALANQASKHAAPKVTGSRDGMMKSGGRR